MIPACVLGVGAEGAEEAITLLASLTEDDAEAGAANLLPAQVQGMVYVYEV